MWSIQDDVRRSLRRLLELLGEPDPLLSELNGEIGKLYFNVHAVIFREEAIVFPILSKLFDIRELNEMFAESATFGFCFLAPREQDIFLEQARIIGASLPKSDIRSTAALSGKSLLQLATGALSLDVLEAILRTLPVDATFVDAADHVAWFSNNPNRIFPRTPSILGRDVRNCHPKESVDKVVALLEDFKSGRRDREAFWIQRKDSFIHIEYFALRGPGGRYLGTLEVSQDLTGKRSLKGEKRLA